MTHTIEEKGRGLANPQRYTVNVTNDTFLCPKCKATVQITYFINPLDDSIIPNDPLCSNCHTEYSILY